MKNISLHKGFAMLALLGGLATAADAGIVITLTDNGDNTIGSRMSGDFTIHASASSQSFGSFGSYIGPDNGTISNVSTSDAPVLFVFNYVDAGGDASGGIAAAYGPGAYAPSAYTGTGHLFQNFTSSTFKIDPALTTNLTIGGAITGGVISGISASGTYVGSFASTGITAGTVVTRYGADSSNYDTLTIITIPAVPEPGTFGLSLLALGAIGLRRRRATNN
ncbi:MAG: hypothetical protein ACJA16_003721 [Akkermansiaceae bacterium]|jgi:hypothetical protein